MRQFSLLKTSINTASDDRKSQQLNSPLQLTIEELYDKYSAILYGVAIRITGNKPDAEAVLSEAFIEINKRIDKIQSDPGQALLCMVAIVRRIAGKNLSLSKSTQQTFQYFTPNELINTSEKSGPAHSMHSGNIIDLVIFNGLSISEVAEIKKISVQDAMRILRNEVNNYRNK